MSIPLETRPLRMDPDLSTALEELLAPYSGKELEKAQRAVRELHKSGISGSFGSLISQYAAAVKDATGS